MISWDVESWRRVGQRVSFLSVAIPSLLSEQRGGWSCVRIWMTVLGVLGMQEVPLASAA